MIYGTIMHFDNRATRRYGFIEIVGGDDQLFFHENNYHHPLNPRWLMARMPMKGDRVAFKVASGQHGRPKARPWAYANEMTPKVKEGEPLVLAINDIPWIGRESLRPNDYYAQEFGGNCERWEGIIFRRSTGEIFRISCHDGVDSSYIPRVYGEGPLPAEVIIHQK